MTATLSPAAHRIIGQLNANHTANTAAGLGSPALDDFHNLVIELIAEAADPKARMREIADLIASHRTASTGGAR
ncbi:hypothetical protein ABTY98_21895 [Streptomyces sp. NPDC096040]|uniref:hypothetical protein n=1 Tax=Streptomyces sp. NPDC096040 TaxID=3155541 RepID=UPI00332D18CB